MSKKYHIFTDIDLDGICSYLTCSWMLNEYCSYTTCRVNDLKEKVTQWLDRNKLEDYEAVYFLDLDVSSHDLLEQIDKDNVHIYDHHDTHIANIDKYKNAHISVEQATSTCRLLYNKNESLTKSLNQNQKLLILMADDYDSYKFNVPNSYELNVLLWSLTGDRFGKFTDMFKDGFVGFNQQQQNIINLYANKLNRVLGQLEVYNAAIPIKGETYNMYSTFASECINDVADHILSNYKCDVVMVVNPKSRKVSFRKDKKCELDLSLFSQSVCDEAGGHKFASGGMLCDKYMNFSKLFNPIA
ncbi:DHH family phosphoesterase [bacterium]|nr:DHH family phosphoesterase [bacterium]